MTSLTQLPSTEDWTPSLTEYDSDSYDDDYDEDEEKSMDQFRRARRTAMSMTDVEKLLDTDYLAKVNIENYETTNPNLMNEILNQDIFNFTIAKNTVDEVVRDIVNKDKKKRKHDDGIWKYCTKNCVGKLIPLINKELKSTAFMLRFMSNSTIDITADDDGLKTHHPLTLKTNKPTRKPITGLWETDKELFDLKPLDLRESANARFIAGLGPSAAGKTYWAKNAIELLGKTDPTFPKSFLSIDGGSAREFSEVYQDIIRALKEHPEIGGFKNLVSAGWDPIHTSLFSAGKVKKATMAYLEEQKIKNNGRGIVSLYVPETLGNPLDDSKKKLDKFVEATGDYRWIGLYIWQGVTPKKDKEWVDKIKKQYSRSLASENIEAKSTTVSGQSREKTEGKLYSSSAYGTSKTHGLAMMKIAPGARIDIHNSGGKKTGDTFNKSVVQEYPNKDGRYILSQELLTPYNAIYIQKSGKKGGRRTRKIRMKKNRRTRKRKNKSIKSIQTGGNVLKQAYEDMTGVVDKVKLLGDLQRKIERGDYKKPN